MDAALYFELVDAVARIDRQVELVAVSERIARADMHPLERRVLDRALRARSEAITLHSELLIPDLFRGAAAEAKPLAAGG
jgi:hypothetical protein